MLLIICYASWRVTRATRLRAAGEIETGATGSASEIDEDSRGREREKEREREEKEREAERSRGAARASDPHGDALRSIEDE